MVGQSHYLTMADDEVAALLHKSGVVTLKYPIEHGTVANWIFWRRFGTVHSTTSFELPFTTRESVTNKFMIIITYNDPTNKCIWDEFGGCNTDDRSMQGHKGASTKNVKKKVMVKSCLNQEDNNGDIVYKFFSELLLSRRWQLEDLQCIL